MAYKFNPFISNLDYYEPDSFRGVLTIAPSNPQAGWMYVNSGNDKLYVYYNGNWQVLHTLLGITYATPSIGMPMGLLLGLTYGFDA
jgi:hypothetical protein